MVLRVTLRSSSPGLAERPGSAGAAAGALVHPRAARPSHRAAFLLAVTLLAGVLSGCVSEGGGATEDGGEGDATPQGPVGAIEGYVTSENLVPIPNATVTPLSDPSRATLTDPDGYYQLANLSVGAVTVNVDLMGYVPAIRSTYVEEGKTKSLSFQLAEVLILVAEEPYQVPGQFSGFIGCAFVLHGSSFNHDCGDTNHDPSDGFTTNVNLNGIVFEARWPPALVTTSNELEFQVQAKNIEGNNDVTWKFRGTSGMIFEVSEEDLTTRYPPYNRGGFALEKDRLNWTVTALSGAEAAGVLLQQGFEVWFTQFYVDPPPADHSPKAYYEEGN